MTDAASFPSEDKSTVHQLDKIHTVIQAAALQLGGGGEDSGCDYPYGRHQGNPFVVTAIGWPRSRHLWNPRHIRFLLPDVGGEVVDFWLKFHTAMFQKQSLVVIRPAYVFFSFLPVMDGGMAEPDHSALGWTYSIYIKYSSKCSLRTW